MTFNKSTIQKRNKKIRGAGIIYYYYIDKKLTILCVKGTQSNKWGLPKGSFKNIKETFKECAIREMYEETNIKITKSQINTKNSLDFGNHKYFIIKAFTFSKKINDKSEINDIQWMNKSKIESLDKNAKNIGLRKFTKWLDRYFK